MLSRHPGWERHAPSDDNVVPFRARRRPVIELGAARRDDDAPGASSSASRKHLLGEDELRAIETQYPDGLTAVHIVEAFTSRGIKLSEASFRKYVQQGLLPRSKRIGRKGKHKGSLGMYPAKTVRRINTVKQLMLDGYTIEEIQTQFLHYTDLIEGIAEHLAELWRRFERDDEALDPPTRKELRKAIAEVRRTGEDLVTELEDIARRIAAPRTNTLRLAGAAGGAEDLL